MQNAYPLQFAPRVLWAKRSGTSEGKTGRKGSGPAGTWGVSPAAAQALAFATVGTRARVARADDISRTHTSGRRRGSPKTGCAASATEPDSFVLFLGAPHRPLARLRAVPRTGS